MDLEIHATSGSKRRNRQGDDVVRRTQSVARDMNHQDEQHLIQAVVERRNMKLAFKRVITNKGAPGIDGMTVDDLKQWLIENWYRLKEDR